MEPNINRTDDLRMQPPTFEQKETIKGMFENLYADMTQLFEKEKSLIRSEVSDKVSTIKKAGTSMAVGGALLFVGVFALVATAIIALNLVVPLWASALIVTAVLLLVGFILVKGAQKKIAVEEMKPRHSIETIGEIKNTFKERINEYKQHH